MRGMREQNNQIINQHWRSKNLQVENIRKMGIDSKNQVNLRWKLK